jgi:hypothetical protein
MTSETDGVTHADGILRFHVPSRSVGGETHLVDLNTHHPACTCRWWIASVAPALRRGERPKKYCYHYIAAYRAFSKWAIIQFSNQEAKNNQ